MASFFEEAPKPRLAAYKAGSYQVPSEASVALLAADMGDASAVAAALAAGARCLFFQKGTSALHLACAANAAAAVGLMLESYCTAAVAAPPSSPGLAAPTRAACVAEALGARTDSSQETPLLSACGAGAKDVVALLLGEGGDPKTANSYGSTCLHLASRAPVNAAACVSLLLGALGTPPLPPAVVDAANNRGSAPLHFALLAAPAVRAGSVLEAVAGARIIGALQHVVGATSVVWHFLQRP